MLLGNLLIKEMTELHQAVAAGDLDLVKEILLRNKCNPNHRDVDWNYKTPLHWAAAKDYPQWLDGHWENDGNVLENGHTDIVRILIENGARPCLRTDNGWTPAHFAAESGRLSVLRLLHSLHAPIDKEDFYSDKPIRLAEIYGHSDCVNFLQSAETESKAYRQMAAHKGISLDDSDEEWKDQGNEAEPMQEQ